MSGEELARTGAADRLAWRKAATTGRKEVEHVHATWGVAFTPPYRENSREPLRDETFRKWHEHGALRKRPGLPTSSSKPRWALIDDFADLFDPFLGAGDVESAATAWRDNHLDPGTRLKANFAIDKDKEAAEHAIIVTLPNKQTRTLEPGMSSVILKGVIEAWAAARMIQPVVLAISEPGDKIHLGDARACRPWESKSTRPTSWPTHLSPTLARSPSISGSSKR